MSSYNITTFLIIVILYMSDYVTFNYNKPYFSFLENPFNKIEEEQESENDDGQYENNIDNKS